MEDVPQYVSFTFLACVVTTFGFLYFAVKKASAPEGNATTIFTTLLSAWIFLVSLITLNDFFLNFKFMPPRLFLFVFIALVAIALLFARKQSRAFIDKLPITTLTYVHIIRVPVEIVLWWLFAYGAVSESMTFEGVNYDILSGISAPFAGLFFVGLKSKSRIAAIIWNLLTLALLVNIVSRAIYATPYFFDPAVLDQPNLAVFYFPYSLLPTFIVPAVFFCHIASLYKLFKSSNGDEES